MKLRSLYVSAFKNLNRLRINFSEEWVTVLLGWNGTGKSNLIEACVLIFKELDLGKLPSFPFRLEYECNGKNVLINAVEEHDGVESIPASKHIKVTVGDDLVSFSKFCSADYITFRPGHVFGYYSGPSNRLEEHFDEHQRIFYRELLKGTKAPLRRLFYARPVHANFVLLSFFSKVNGGTQYFLRDLLGIEGFESALFVLRQPPWFKGDPSEELRQQGDKRFWFARGAVKSFLARLYDVALAPMRLSRKLAVDFQSKPKQVEHFYLFIRDQKSLQSLAQHYSSQAEFFKVLESTYLSNLLVEVRVRVKMRGCSGSLIFRELSEGEQQLLTVLGLLEFTKEKESLFLLDEPDTHLNPAWSVRYLALLEEVLSGHDKDKSQVIVATHDPLFISGLCKEQVRVFRRTGDDRMTTTFQPDEDPRGMGVVGLLTSDMFGLRSDLDPQTLQLIDEKVKIATKDGKLSKKEKDDLKKIDDELDRVGLLSTFSDPYFMAFLKGVARRKKLDTFGKATFTKEEIADQKTLVDEVLADLDKEG
jgi:predicted ATPase